MRRLPKIVQKSLFGVFAFVSLTLFKHIDEMVRLIMSRDDLENSSAPQKTEAPFESYFATPIETMGGFSSLENVSFRGKNGKLQCYFTVKMMFTHPSIG